MPVKFHFLNVGVGDCTIVHFPSRIVTDSNGSVIKEKNERIMIVDLNHHDDHEEYEHVMDYYKSNPDFRNYDRSLKPIFRFICSHPHQDHICGLAKLFEDSEIKIWNFWDLDHKFLPEDFDHYETHEDDWNMYTKKRKGDGVTVIKTHREDNPRDFWKDDEDRITILSPSLELIRKAHYSEDGSKKNPVEIDEMSYALLIRINKRKVILGGDGKERVWTDIVENCSDDIKNCSILKAAHHGHKAGFHDEAVKIMNPNFIVFSNSKEEDNENGAEKEYNRVLSGVTIYKTCNLGTLTAKVPFKSNEEIIFYRA